MKQSLKIVRFKFKELKLITTSTFILFNLFMYSQGHISFPFQNGVWKYGMYDASCSGPGSACGTVTYKFQGDTVINSVSYKILLATYPNTSLYYYAAAIREDTVTGKLFIFYPSSTQCNGIDTLLYSFIWNMSDTLFQCDRVLGTISQTIDSIDSVLIQGQWRIRINLNSAFGTQLIEGLGSTTGLIGPWEGWIGGNLRLECFELNGVPVFPSSNCGTNDVGDINLQKLDYLIYPTLANDIVYVKQNSFNEKKVDANFFDINGRKVKSIILNFDENLPIEISTCDLQNGVFFISIVSPKDIPVVKTLIINH